MNPDAIKDGGAAYPGAMSEQTHSNQYCAPYQQGMSLRDHFAGQAMHGLLGNCQGDFGVNHKTSNMNLALAAYAIADTMISAREA